ncbi:Zn-dependent protease with chaperone function [Comamonas odontotermitis]|uniref:Zn-dependent protease with chaperone function n=1 Tax=Comamonas odontotermitis TaxID=379895 RepID=A0ABR6RB95_9BURK|nr:Zn-dependent protease with chaperone function [Comamonas odontotermitis]
MHLTNAFLSSLQQPRRLLQGLAMGAAMLTLATPVVAQVEVGKSSAMRNLVPAETLEQAAVQQYGELLAQARQQGALAQPGNAQLQRLQTIAQRLIPQALAWNDRARSWKWEVNLIGSKQINAFCMPGGKIVFFTGLIDQLQLTDDEIAMVMGHEMAHALREHSREQLAKTQATDLGIRLGAAIFGLGDMGTAAANLGGKLLTLKFSRSDESDADLVGLEMAARAGYNPQASVTLWEKMGQANGGGGIGFLSTHPTGPDRIAKLQANVPKVAGLYEQARKR